MFTLALVGRPNVGKSTLFNLLAGKKMALVDDTPGLTRDWREAEGHIMGHPLRIIDTAGLEEKFDDSIQARMRRQTESALKQADAVLFLIDGRAGLTPMDEHFATWLRKRKIPVILGVNKCESEKASQAAMAESYSLGLGDPVALSAAHGLGLDDLYHALKPHLPPLPEEDEEEFGEGEEDISEAGLDELEGREDYVFAQKDIPDTTPLRLAIVGRPNVGKSTLLNMLVGSERVMTGPEAGITRDAIAVSWTYQGRTMRLVDTAGLRKKARVTDAIERMATGDTLRAIRLAQVVVLLLDGTMPLEKQDLTIAQHVTEEGRALIVAVNKWDAVEDKDRTRKDLKERVELSLAQVRDVPVVTISARDGKGMDKLMDEVLNLFSIWNTRVPTARLNRWLAALESRHPAPMAKGRANRLKYMTQLKSRPPTFALWLSQPDGLADSYKRYLINGLRQDFNMPGTPIRLYLRASKNPFKK